MTGKTRSSDSSDDRDRTARFKVYEEMVDQFAERMQESKREARERLEETWVRLDSMRIQLAEWIRRDRRNQPDRPSPLGLHDHAPVHNEVYVSNLESNPIVESRDGVDSIAMGNSDTRLKKMEIPIFEGLDASGWLNAVERFFALGQYTDGEKLELISLSLAGSALRWYNWEIRHVPFESWMLFRDKLLLRYGTTTTYSRNQSLSPESMVSATNTNSDEFVRSSTSTSEDTSGSIEYVVSSDPPMNEIVVKSMFSAADSALQFKKGLEEARRFLPNSDQWVIKEEIGLRVKKSREREVLDADENRSSKQSATNVEEEGKITDMFDKVLLLDGECDPQIDGETIQSGNGNNKKGVKKRNKKSQVIDFRTLLTLCAQALSTGDKTTALALLLQIRQQSTPLGDASQRLAHFFANALEARLADFGILYGFQWPVFIQHVSKRKTGPKKLRIPGIELPQHGFSPTERIQDTGRRLTEYCKRFGVPFEYNAIASKNWETIRMEEFNIRPGEVLAVNTVLRFKNLRDVTPDEENCPRDGFLKLIRDMNPDVFLSSTINGSFNAPFFTTRFKEALFHYSALFDMFGSTLSRENPERIYFEREFYGREVMNVIACEGVDRVESTLRIELEAIFCERPELAAKLAKMEVEKAELQISFDIIKDTYREFQVCLQDIEMKLEEIQMEMKLTFHVSLLQSVLGSHFLTGLRSCSFQLEDKLSFVDRGIDRRHMSKRKKRPGGLTWSV